MKAGRRWPGPGRGRLTVPAALCIQALLLLSCLLSWAHSHAQAPAAAPASQSVEAAAVDLPLLEQFLKDEPTARLHPLAMVSEAFQEDPANPALQLERLWVGASGTMLELRGLQRKGQVYSALIHQDTLHLKTLKSGRLVGFLASDGGMRFEDPTGKKLIRVRPGDVVHLFFAPIEALQAHSLRYSNPLGSEDSYFDRIDPQFRERYDQMFALASGPDARIDGLKAFLMEFVGQDSDRRLQKVFVDLIQRLRAQRSFEGYYDAYALVKDPKDENEARKLAKTDDQRSRLDAAVAVVRQAETLKLEEQRRAVEAKQAELRRREDARLADLRRQEEVKLAELRVVQQREAEARCLQTPACRQAMEDQRAQCAQKIQSCRGNCDRVVGAGSYGSFISNLVAAGMARGCYAGCKCDSGFGEVLGKFNQMAADAAPSIGAAAPTARARAAPGAQSATQSATADRPEKAADAGRARPKFFECKIYCKSANGPVTYKKLEAGSRKDAARLAGDRAGEFCAVAGLSHASAAEFKESQCVEK